MEMRLVRATFVSYFSTQTPHFVLFELFHFEADDWLPRCVTIPATHHYFLLAESLSVSALV